MNFKRIICCIKGHKAFPRRDILDTPEDKPFKSNSISWMASRMKLDEWFSIGGNSPLIAKAHLCARCHGLVWYTSINSRYFTSSDNVPELQSYRDWQKRQTWEEDQRARNPMADKLYNQYQIALKLAQDSND